jgi:YkoY family integral membrane protein
LNFAIQTFGASDIALIGVLVLLEGLLSADNALVLALLVRDLPAKESVKALRTGMVMAYVLRGLGILAAGVVVKLWWLCALGALYLLALTVKHFIHRAKHGPPPPSGLDEADSPIDPDVTRGSYWKTVVAVGFTDAVFAVDSILIAVALVNVTKNPDKLWVVYAGGTLGVLLLGLAAGYFIRLIRRFPSLDDIAYALVGWAGIKLGFAAGHLYNNAIPEMDKRLFWGVFALIVAWGVMQARGKAVGNRE